MSISQNYSFTLNEIERENINIFLDLPTAFCKKTFNLNNDSYSYLKVKRWCDNVKSNNWIVKDKYSTSDCHRQYGMNTTIQIFTNKLRSFIFNKTSHDLDMKNACFGFTRYIINSYFPDKKLEFATLLDYSNQREKYFKNGLNKQDFISFLFDPNPQSRIKKNIYDDDVNILIKEIHNFQRLVINNKHLFNFINLDKAKDSNGSKLSYIIFGLENQLLQECLLEFKTITKSPIFDGFIISNECNLKKVLKRCNELGSKYQIEFTNKKFKEILLPDNIDNSTDYSLVKEEFEENHFYVEFPSQFILEEKINNETFIRRYGKKDFIDLVSPFTIEDKPFLPVWLKDKKRRKYKSIRWCPVIEDNKDHYNSFSGFKSHILKNLDMDLVNPFIEHWDLLCGGEEKVLDYVLKFLAHMIQKPGEIPQVALLFQGLQGTGKDIATSQLGNMIGHSLLHKEEKCENIFGNFNSCIENKLILQINEISGNDGFKHKESFKDIITAENLNIRKMRTDLYETPNFLRCFLFSNNLTPIQIPQDDRRYMVIKTGSPASKNYYSKLVNHYNNEEVNNAIFTYLNQLDISNFSPHSNRVETQAYKNMKELCRNPLYEFLYDILRNESWYGKYTVQGKEYFLSKCIMENYESYTKGTNVIINFKNVKSVLLNLGAVYKRFYKNGNQLRGYEIDVDKVINKLEKYYGMGNEEDEIIYLDSDSESDCDCD